jgi:2'-5' RNA ligase
VARHRPVLVRPREVGAFPGLQRPRVLFLHLDGGDPLWELAAEVRQAVDAVWPDGPQDHKHFRPHLTLARIKRPLAAEELAELRDLDLGEWASFEAGDVELMASDLQPRGARYSVVESLPLGG